MGLLREYGMGSEYANRRFLENALQCHLLLGPDDEGNRFSATGAPISARKVFEKYISKRQYEWISPFLTGINVRWLILTESVHI